MTERWMRRMKRMMAKKKPLVCYHFRVLYQFYDVYYDVHYTINYYPDFVKNSTSRPEILRTSSLAPHLPCRAPSSLSRPVPLAYHHPSSPTIIHHPSPLIINHPSPITSTHHTVTTFKATDTFTLTLPVLSVSLITLKKEPHWKKRSLATVSPTR